MADIEPAQENNTAESDNQPGQVITPSGNDQPTETSIATEAATAPINQIEVPATPPTDDSQSSTTTEAASPLVEQDYSPESSTSEGTSESGESVSWTASEFIAHQKSGSWYVLLGVGAVAISAIVFLLTKDKISTIAILVASLALGVVGARQPKQQQYKLDTGGVTIGQRYFEYDSFRSFSVVPEGAMSSIVFMPLKRFSTYTIIYYAPETEEQIVGILSSRLPQDEHTPDPVDRMMRRIRF